MIYGILIFFVVLTIDLYTDIRLYRHGLKINHARGLVLRLIGLAPAVYFLGRLAIPVLGFAYWILFNGIYNLAIGKNWSYQGTTSKLDQLKIPSWVRYTGFTLSLIIYIWTR